MNKCPLCDSENQNILGQNGTIHEKFHKDFGNGYTEDGTYIYPIMESLCMDCGFVYKYVSERNLEKYNKEKEYFIDSGFTA